MDKQAVIDSRRIFSMFSRAMGFCMVAFGQIVSKQKGNERYPFFTYSGQRPRPEQPQ
jgi:hypothetical protein